MINLNIYLVPKHRTIPKAIDENTATPDSIIADLSANGLIPQPPPTPDGGVTIWKITKGSRGNRPVGSCIGDVGFTDGETVFLVAVP